MASRNTIMAELAIPRDGRAIDKLYGFFNTIGWVVHPDTEESEPHFLCVRPTPARLPAIRYRLTTNPDELARFEENEVAEPSKYALGPRLLALSHLVEVGMVLRSDQGVRRLYRKGGPLLESHCHVPLRTYGGAQEFRLADPFNYSLSVTANTDYQ